MVLKKTCDPSASKHTMVSLIISLLCVLIMDAR